MDKCHFEFDFILKNTKKGETRCRRKENYIVQTTANIREMPSHLKQCTNALRQNISQDDWAINFSRRSRLATMLAQLYSQPNVSRTLNFHIFTRSVFLSLLLFSFFASVFREGSRVYLIVWWIFAVYLLFGQFGKYRHKINENEDTKWFE